MNTTRDDGGPIASGMEVYSQGESQRLFAVGGLSLRDWFAGMALASMDYGWFESSFRIREMAAESYNIADAMLAARKEEL